MSMRSTITNLVMEKFGSKLKDHIQRGVKRRQKRNSQSDSPNKKKAYLEYNYADPRDEVSETLSTCEPYNATFFENSTIEGLYNKINIQNDVILQILKAICFASQLKGFYFGCQHLEMEKFLLIQTFKKELLMKEILNVQYSEVLQVEEGCIVIKGISLFPHYLDSNNKKKDRRYLALIQSNDKVYCSNVIKPTERGELVFEKEFFFNNLPANFEINIYLFYIELKHKMNDFSVSPFILRPSLFQYWCKTKINRHNIKMRRYGTGIESCPMMTVLLETKLSKNYRYSGFASIGKLGKALPLWSLRWCLIEDFKLKYWNHPIDIKHCRPLNVINLMDCEGFGTAKKDVCGRDYCLFIKYLNNVYFLTFNTKDEFNQWKYTFKMIFTCIKIFK